MRWNLVFSLSLKDKVVVMRLEREIALLIRDAQLD
jgi:hypothetical protein